MKPKRIQLSRRKGFKLPPNTVVVSRPSRYGNPHRVGWCPVCGVEHTQLDAVAEFKALVAEQPAGHFAGLRGKNLACWCRLNEPCHADVLLEAANESTS